MRMLSSHRPSLVLTCAVGAVFAAIAWVLPSAAHDEDAASAPPAPAATADVDLVLADGFYVGAALSDANGDTRPVNRAAFIVQAGRTF